MSEKPGPLPFFGVQVRPPSVDFRSHRPPTAQPVVELMKKMLLISAESVTPLLPWFQERPLLVKRIWPLAPQTQAWVASRAVTPWKRPMGLPGTVCKLQDE